MCLNKKTRMHFLLRLKFLAQHNMTKYVNSLICNVKDMGYRTTSPNLTNQLTAASWVAVSWPIPKDKALILSFSVLKASTIEKSNLKTTIYHKLKVGKLLAKGLHLKSDFVQGLRYVIIQPKYKI